MLKNIVGENLSQLQKLIVIDFHTGLGAFGAGEMITEALPRSPPYERAKAMGGARVASSEAGQSVSGPLSVTHAHAFPTQVPRTTAHVPAPDIAPAPPADAV